MLWLVVVFIKRVLRVIRVALNGVIEVCCAFKWSSMGCSCFRWSCLVLPWGCVACIGVLELLKMIVWIVELLNVLLVTPQMKSDQ